MEDTSPIVQTEVRAKPCCVNLRINHREKNGTKDNGEIAAYKSDSQYLPGSWPLMAGQTGEKQPEFHHELPSPC